jgi:predicted enzyme related to lactoylglutathione lyase
MAVTVLFAGVPVADFRAGVAWWERLLGRVPDLYANDNEALWQVAGEGWIYVVGDAARAGGALLTILVDDLAAHVADLAARGIHTAPIETVQGVGRMARVDDPDGNAITFAQPDPAPATGGSGDGGRPA